MMIRPTAETNGQMDGSATRNISSGFPSRVDVTRAARQLVGQRASASTSFFVLSEPPWVPPGSHKGCRALTIGKTEKLCGMGGVIVFHSSESASHGFSPAGAPDCMLRIRLIKNISTLAAIMNAPMVEIRLYGSQPMPAG